MKTVIITGGNSGLGFETAKKIGKASGEYRVILACRNIEKAEEAKKAAISESGNEQIYTMRLDTASLSSVRKFVEEYGNTEFGSTYALLCNAGISGVHTGLTEDGFDVIFGTNHLSHFLLTKLIFPHIAKDGLIFARSSDMHDSPIFTEIVSGSEVDDGKPKPGMLCNDYGSGFDKAISRNRAILF